MSHMVARGSPVWGHTGEPHGGQGLKRDTGKAFWEQLKQGRTLVSRMVGRGERGTLVSQMVATTVDPLDPLEAPVLDNDSH